jgi:type I restriction enzyme S subunit
MGQAPKGSTYNEDGVGWPLVAGAGDFVGSTVRPAKFTTQPTRLSIEGDILLGIRAPSAGEPSRTANSVWVEA